MGEVDGSSNPNPSIKLMMLNGPLSGQIFDFNPGSKVHVGRIVRGNAVTIKDAGVSSKHLLIEFQLQLGRWMVSDLDSSNGTFLNGRLLDPFNPAQISHGDVIKIGESTSISVEIGVNEEECMMRRNPPRGRGRNLAGKNKKKNVNEMDKNYEELEGMMDKVGKVEAKAEEKAGPIRVSSVKQEKISGVWEKSAESVVEAVVIEEEKNEGSKRVTRGMKKKAHLMGEVCQQRITRGMKEGKVLDNLEENVGQANKKTRKGRKGKQNLVVVNVQPEKEDVVLTSDTKLDETKDARVDNKLVNNEVAEMCEEGEAVDPLVLEKSVNSGSMNFGSSSKHHNSVALDLENMTLGDLFDHWEVSLPKQIIDATELMISDMKEKSKRFHEFRAQKIKEKDGVNSSIGIATKRN